MVFSNNNHSVSINSTKEAAYPEVILWGEASWWPKRSLMRFVRKTEGAPKVGTIYLQKVLLPFAPSWDARIEQIDSDGITRKFLNGMFVGQETVNVVKMPASIVVEYQMSYSIKGAVNRILWKVIFEKLHNKNLESILNNLKRYLEGNIENKQG